MDIRLFRRGWIGLAASLLVVAACGGLGSVGPAASPSPLALITAPVTPSAVPTLATAVPPATPEATLIPAISDAPAAGICAEAEGQWATVEIQPDVPSPRCLKVTAQQRLKAINRTEVAVRVELGPFALDLQPGAEGALEQPFGAFLAPGVHQVLAPPYSGPEVWLVGN